MSIILKGKKLPANLDAEAEEGDVSDEDSAEEEDEEEEEDIQANTVRHLPELDMKVEVF